MRVTKAAGDGDWGPGEGGRGQVRVTGLQVRVTGAADESDQGFR